MFETRPVPSTYRPGIVTGAVILVAAGGLGALTAGIAALTVTNAAASVGVLFLLWGAAFLGVAHGLSTGREWARTTAAAMSVVELLACVFLAVRTDGLVHDGGMVAGTLSVAVLAILCTPQAGAFFQMSPVTTAAPRPLVATPGVR